MADVQQVYLALFGRPADPGGLAFWQARTSNGADLGPMLAALAPLPEYQSRFVGLSTEQQIVAVYQALFNRPPDATGLSFFAARLQSGELTLATFAVNILDGAQNEDRQIIANKITAANAFTQALDTVPEQNAYAGDAAAAAGRDFLDDITADPATIPSQGEVDAAVAALLGGGAPPSAEPQTLVLTDGPDVLTGGSAADTFVAGSASVLDTGDTLTGGDGADILRITAASEALNGPIPTLSGIETVQITNAVFGSSIDMANASGVERIVSQGSLQQIILENVQSLVRLEVSSTSSTASDVYLRYASSAVSGSLDNQTIAFSNAGGASADSGTIFADGIERFTVEVSGANYVEGLRSDTLDFINVSGAGTIDLGSVVADGFQSLTVTGAAGVTASFVNVGTSPVIVNASGTTGANTLDASLLAVTTDGGRTVTITGGSADDLLVAPADLGGGSAVATLTGGSGADTFRFDPQRNDIITDFGTGADRLQIGEGTIAGTFVNALDPFNLLSANSLDNINAATSLEQAYATVMTEIASGPTENRAALFAWDGKQYILMNDDANTTLSAADLVVEVAGLSATSTFSGSQFLFTG